jgi:hypothetical protein
VLPSNLPTIHQFILASDGALAKRAPMGFLDFQASFTLTACDSSVSVNRSCLQPTVSCPSSSLISSRQRSTVGSEIFEKRRFKGDDSEFVRNELSDFMLQIWSACSPGAFVYKRPVCLLVPAGMLVKWSLLTFISDLFFPQNVSLAAGLGVDLDLDLLIESADPCS